MGSRSLLSQITKAAENTSIFRSLILTSFLLLGPGGSSHSALGSSDSSQQRSREGFSLTPVTSAPRALLSPLAPPRNDWKELEVLQWWVG